MTSTTLDTRRDGGTRTRRTTAAPLARLQERVAVLLAERRELRAFRAQERAFAGVDGAQYAELVHAARRA